MFEIFARQIYNHCRGFIMANFADRLKQLRKEKNLIQKELGALLDIKRSTIAAWESNNTMPEISAVQKLADFFGVSLDYLLARTENRNKSNIDNAYIPKNTVELPILGVVRAGEPIYAEQNILGYFSIDASLIPPGDCFYLRVIGDSMDLSHIVEGQLILIKRQEEVENGEIALVLVNGEDATVKKFYKTGNMVNLQPHSSNPVHQLRIIDIKKTDVKVIGRVVGTFITL